MFYRRFFFLFFYLFIYFFFLSRQSVRVAKPHGKSLKELRLYILGHFIYTLIYGLSFEKPKNDGLLRKENTKGLILKQKGTRMAEDGED